MKGRYLVALLPLVLAGCLLPQPDTPPIKPSLGAGNALPSAPSLGKPTVPNNSAAGPTAGGADASSPVGGAPNVSNPATAPVTAPAAATLSGSVRGLEATAIAAVLTGGTPTFKDLSQAGAFTLSLPPGSYALAFKLSDGRTVQTDARVTLAPGQMLAVSITLGDSPLTATIDEQTPLVVSASATATPTPKN